MGCCKSKSKILNANKIDEKNAIKSYQSSFSNESEKQNDELTNPTNAIKNEFQVKVSRKMSMKTNKIGIINKETSFRHGRIHIGKNYTPEELSYISNWKNMHEDLKSNAELNNYGLSKTVVEFNDLNELIQFFKDSPAKTETEKVYLIYLWITHNIVYDVDSYKTGDYKSQEAEAVFDYGMGVCDGYSNLFLELCNGIGIECIKIIGYSKGFGYEIGDKLTVDHAWNAVKLNNEFNFVECTWGSGVVTRDFKFRKMFNPYYFCTPADVFIYTHYHDTHQYKSKKISLNEFERLPFLDIRYHLFGLSIINEQILTDSKNPIFIEYTAPKETILIASLHNENDKIIENSIIIQRDVNTLKYAFIVFLPLKNTKYCLKLYAKENKNNEFIYIGKYLVQRTGDEGSFEFPSYDLEFDYNVKCVSHNCLYISTDRNPMFFEFSVPNDVEILASLLNDKNHTIENAIQIQKDRLSIKYGIFAVLPNKNAKYKLNLFAKKQNQADFVYLTQFTIMKTDNQLNFYDPGYSIEHDFGIKCYTHNTQLIYADKSELDLEFYVPSGVDLIANIKDSNNVKINDMILVQNSFDKKNISEVKVSISSRLNKFSIELFAKQGDDSHKYIATYTVINTHENKKLNDRKFLFTFNKDKIKFYIASPIEKCLDSRREYEFRVLIENCKELAFILPDSKRVYFKQDRSNENLWLIKLKINKIGNANLYAKTKSNSSFECICGYEVI